MYYAEIKLFEGDTEVQLQWESCRVSSLEVLHPAIPKMVSECLKKGETINNVTWQDPYASTICTCKGTDSAGDTLVLTIKSERDDDITIENIKNCLLGVLKIAGKTA
jgi:hypothetical protein